MTTHIDPSEPLLTKQQVCEILGVNQRFLNLEIKEGRIPHLRLSKKKIIRFRPEHIEEYLSSKEAVAPEASGAEEG